MANKNGRYVQFYTSGTAAVKVKIQEEYKWAPLPAPKPEKKIAVFVDPVAMVAFAVAVCMLILLAVGVGQMNDARREVNALEHYVAQLTAENHALEETYNAGYELWDIEQKAFDMGMTPAEEVKTYHIYIPAPQVQTAETPTGWEKFTGRLTGLFA